MKPLIGITMGDPKGIGPETIARAWQGLTDAERGQFRIYGDRAAFDAAATLCGSGFDPKELVICSSTGSAMGALSDAEAARMALSAINAAIEDARAGRIAAVVTAPVNKRRLQSVEAGFLGHTEYLARATRSRDAVMMFASEGRVLLDAESGLERQLCISMTTTHLPISDVPKAVTRERVLATIRRTHEALERHFALPEGRIAVLALNPHAGEGGTLGDEEERAIAPAVARAQEEGINCVGPLPADGVFTRLSDFDYDALVAMYHDQGMLPVKLLCQGRCVNLTLGLPFIRTSPGHGTAEKIAWLGKADAQGMQSAMQLTRRLVGWTIEDNNGLKAKG